MRNIYTVSLISFLLLSVSSLFGQRGDFVEGKLFVKLHNEAGIILPEMQSKEDIVLFDSYQLPELVSLMNRYQVNQVERAFDGMGSEDLDNTYTFYFERKGMELELMDRLMGLAIVDYAERSPIYYPDLVPDDYNMLTQWSLDKIGATSAWDHSTGSDKVVIAVVDAAIYTDHRDLTDNMWTNANEIPNNGIDDDNNGYVDDVIGWDAADEDNDPNPPSTNSGNHTHGTQVAGSASAVTNNNTDIAGIGFSCAIMPVKVKRNVISNPNFPTGLEATAEGVAYAVAAEPSIINMSFGGPNSTQTVQNIINLGHSKGIIFVGSSGNDTVNVARYPASYTHVISVGATNRNDRKAVFSNWASTVDIVAPGDNILTITHNNSLNETQERVDGTSFSAPIVAGTIGLMLSVNPCLTLSDIENILDSTSVNIDALNPNFTSGLGYGRLDAAAAVAAAAPSSAPVAQFVMIDSCGGNIRFLYDGPLNSCGQNFFWNFNGKISTEPNASFPHPGPGTYNLTMVVNNSIGTANANQQITLGNPISIDAGGDENGVLTSCFNQLVTIDATSSLANATYTWSPSSGLFGAGTLTPSLTATVRRIYTLTAVAPNGCILSDRVEIVPINSVFAGQDKTINLGDSTQLNVTVVGNSGYTYEWSPTNGLSNPFIKNPKASPASTTTYTAKVITGTGCELDDDVTVTTIVGLEEEFAAVGTVLPAFPNPAANEMFLAADIKSTTTLSVKAYDLTGREVATFFDGKTPQGNLQLSWKRADAIRAGIYLLVWQTPEVHFVQKVQWK